MADKDLKLTVNIKEGQLSIIGGLPDSTELLLEVFPKI